MTITTQKTQLEGSEFLRYAATWESGGQKITINSQIFFEDDLPRYKASMLERFARQIIRHLDVHPTPGWKKSVRCANKSPENHPQP